MYKFINTHTHIYLIHTAKLDAIKRIPWGHGRDVKLRPCDVQGDSWESGQHRVKNMNSEATLLALNPGFSTYFLIAITIVTASQGCQKVKTS